jgi:hypothetical protein
MASESAALSPNWACKLLCCQLLEKKGDFKFLLSTVTCGISTPLLMQEEALLYPNVLSFQATIPVT